MSARRPNRETAATMPLLADSLPPAPTLARDPLNTQPQQALRGSVVRTRYHEAGTRYSVLIVQVPGRADLITAVGRADAIEDGAELELRGQWIDHERHGRQFAFEQVVIAPPSTPAAVIRRLTMLPGIGDVVAERIVRRFGDDALGILRTQPGRLREVEGIGPKTLERIVEYLRTRSGPLVMLEELLVELGLPPRLAGPIHRRYGELAAAVVREQPYRLAREVGGIGFLTADRIARGLGIAASDPERVTAGVAFALDQARGDGHVALPRPRLVERAERLLGCDRDAIEQGIDALVSHEAVVVEAAQGSRQPPLCYLSELWQAERAVAAAFVDLALAARDPWVVGTLPRELSLGQVRAVEAIAHHGMAVLTGGPGTGKSTVVAHVLAVARAHDCEVFLAAPTGRAAKRLEQATGIPAKTVHRLLEIQGESGGFGFHLNNPLPPGLVVIDEASMLDVELAEALLTALTPEHRLLIVGDADQLPSVGPGNVLRDIITACEDADSPVPVVRLDKIFRQDEGSSIVRNAHCVLRGAALVPDEAGSRGDFFFSRATDEGRAHEMVLKAALERIPEVFGLNPRTDVQVLCPMHRGRAGTDALNAALQARLTGDAPGIAAPSAVGGGRWFRRGDRVMQTKNDYGRGVFNGDIGTVLEIREDPPGLVVDIDGVPIEYEFKDLGALRLAYAITIHKSQGSEFPAVIIPILAEFDVMLRRNLLYTAITRARRLCVVIGDPSAVDRAIRRSDAARRYTALAERIHVALSARLGNVRLVTDPDLGV